MDDEESNVFRLSAVEIVATTDEQHVASVAEIPGACPAQEVQKSDSGIRFGQVRIHEHKNILGDNPSVSKGPPITLDWDVLASHRICLDEYETEKLRLSCEDVAADADGKTMGSSSNVAVRRPTRIPAPERYNIVRAAGHSRSSLERVHSEIQLIKKELKKQHSADDVVSPSSPPPTAEEQELVSNPAPAWLRWIANRRAAKKNTPMRKPKANRVV